MAKIHKKCSLYLSDMYILNSYMNNTLTLIAFLLTSLAVTMTIIPDDLSLLDKDMNRIVEPGEFDLFISASSTDVRH